MHLTNLLLALALTVTSTVAQSGDQPDLQPRELPSCAPCHQRCRDDRGAQSRHWLIDCYNGCTRIGEC
ncbi:unnamed protein product [Zymoseptoria tritici ST99CH_1A5]|uniref:Uncharacterized protein n=2 Tax=Zymoseptoria tritici TaxID=1047171 RepID=A0A2H1H054_ZYMTR|nr:unnamed protein product [Zymoseptoria tritici ST99CH_1E4]SMY28381.1 unnamed protein product [Zymoseptoria tritici ST99CH_1A5]